MRSMGGLGIAGEEGAGIGMVASSVVWVWVVVRRLTGARKEAGDAGLAAMDEGTDSVHGTDSAGWTDSWVERIRGRRQTQVAERVRLRWAERVGDRMGLFVECRGPTPGMM